MTAIVAIQCTDGIVIGSDSAMTQNLGQLQFFGQVGYNKVRLIGGQIIAAVSGNLDCHHRCCAALEAWAAHPEINISRMSDVDFGTQVSLLFRNTLGSTGIDPTQLDYNAVIAFPSINGPALVQISAQNQFQPQFVSHDGLWFMSSGSGIFYTNPFLGFLRRVFWPDGPPNVAGGLFSAYWALAHACDVSPGGIAEPLKFAVLQEREGQPEAREASQEEMQLHKEYFDSVNQHLREFKSKMEGDDSAADIPAPPVED